MEEKDLVMKIFEWKKQYDNIYATTISEQLFVFRALKRKEFNSIFNNPEWNDQDKEEAFCETVVLYPTDYDFAECPAGTPVVLAEKILSESLFLEDGKADVVINRNRQDMYIYENQIECIITEAFPTIRLDEIQEWDMHKTLYYLSRAEFVLNKMRGLPFVSQQGEVYNDMEEYNGNAQQYQQSQYQQPQYQEYPEAEEEYYVDDEFSKDIDEFDGNASMSVPNLKELQELQKICPEIDWMKEDSLLNRTFNFEEEAKIAFNAEDAVD